MYASSCSSLSKLGLRTKFRYRGHRNLHGRFTIWRHELVQDVGTNASSTHDYSFAPGEHKTGPRVCDDLRQQRGRYLDKLFAPHQLPDRRVIRDIPALHDVTGAITDIDVR